jgi:hypothetical protein
MTSPTSGYSQFESQHKSLLEQFQALIRFKAGVYNSLALAAMVSPMRHEIGSTRGVKVASLPAVVAMACELASAAKIDDAQTVKAVRQYLRWVTATSRRLGKGKTGGRQKTRSQSEKVIDEAISRRRSAIESELTEIPPSIEKAWAALACEILSEDADDGSPPDALNAFGADEARRRFKDSITRRRQDLLNGNAMRTSARGYEPYWYTSYLRYYETFEPKDARSILLSEARDIEDEVRESASRVNAGRQSAAYELPRFLDLMYAYGRCRTVRHALVSIARRAIPTVLSLQKPDGAWSDWQQSKDSKTPTLADDAEVTAQAVLFLARYGSPEECERTFAGSQRWLAEAQNEDGSWRSDPGRSAGRPISTTTVVLEALRHTAIPIDHPVVSKGEAFLIRHQQPPGLWWERSGLWETHLTSQVLEYFESRVQRPGTLSSYLKSARSLLLKSEQLALSEDQTDVLLATAAAYHGLEHFLYGCILQMDSDEIIYGDKGTTIGLNSALGVFERALKARGELQPNSRLPYRQQIQHLHNKRDMFIHRAESIQMTDAFGFVATCRAFVQKYDLTVLGFRLCG